MDVTGRARYFIKRICTKNIGDFPLFTEDRMANYGDGNLMTPTEQQAQKILMEGATSYQPFMDEASRIAGTLGQGYGMTRQELLGDPYQGATRQELLELQTKNY